MFRDRIDAAERLAKVLEKFECEHPVVLAVPRGAVPMGEVIAKRIHAPLDVVLVHKIGAPDNPELAVGSATEFGDVYPNDVADYYNLTGEALRRLAESEIETLHKRRRAYRKMRPEINLENKCVIIVDDGIATGATIVAAIRSIKKQNPKRIIVATAVAPPATVLKLKEECDDVVTLSQPEPLYGVGMYFDDFEQVTDGEVEKILKGAAS